MSMTPMNNKRK